ncbi:Short-chain alcohol dehydrogenase family [hydrothermal vent metagenome]|uniref:trans-2-enoyl-CoA reductase (NAD(+)) n=1 Tax=hydrothermal vent metagenome TaxID=652676 RepID=A0A3B1D3K4_9ZZZZ
MIIEPKTRGFICITAHPAGCAQHVQEQINYVKSQGTLDKGPKKVLIIGASTGYGLASRIMASFGCGAQTIGVFFEKPADKKRTASAGWYNSAGFEQKAVEAGIYAKSFNGDAFSDEMKKEVIDTIKRDWGKVDLIIYSLASPRRQHPKTGEIAKSVLKPLGRPYTNKSINLTTDQLEDVTLPTATEEEISQTISVMGGEDWEMWIDALEAADVLAEGTRTVAYSYIGPKLTKAVYRNGTIGKAKDHLEATSHKLNERLKKKGGRAFISVNKALVTQSSSAIPFIPLYFILLTKVMKAKELEEDCIEQIYRLFATCLYEDIPCVDENGFIRMDDHELSEDVQGIVDERWNNLTSENLKDYADLKGYHADFLRLFGFGLKGVDYKADYDQEVPMPSLVLESV